MNGHDLLLPTVQSRYINLQACSDCMAVLHKEEKGNQSQDRKLTIEALYS
jgi:hypothetical protein